MVGEGLKRTLHLDNVTLLQVDKSTSCIAALYKKEEQYIRVKWSIAISSVFTDGKVIDNSALFLAEKQGEISFQSAEYITHLCSNSIKLSSKEYYNEEFMINDSLFITDDFLYEQTQKGQNILRFEQYLLEH